MPTPTHGSSSGLATSAAWTAETDSASSWFGWSVSTAGDVNGDGYSDVIAGAHHFDNGESSEGRAHVYHGSPSAMAANPDRTGAGDGPAATFAGSLPTSPIAVLAPTGTDGLFRLRVESAVSLAGHSWASPATPEVWLEWEIEPLGVAFDGAGIQRGASQPLMSSGGTVSFDELVDVDDGSAHRRTTRVHGYHARARIATSNPLLPRTAWFGVQGNTSAGAVRFDRNAAKWSMSP